MANRLNALTMDRILAFRGLLKVGLADPFPMLLMIGTGNFQTVVSNPSRNTITSKQAIQIGFTGTEGGFMYHIMDSSLSMIDFLRKTIKQKRHGLIWI